MLRKSAVLLCLAVLASFIILPSCMGPVNVGYIKANPDIDPTRKRFQYPLNIVLGNRIQDTVPMEGSIRTVTLNEYRKTLGDMLKAMFENNFREVTVSPMEQNRGVELVFNRFEPYQAQQTDGLKIGMRLHAEILKDGVPKGQINGEDIGNFKAISWGQMDKTVESALQKMCRGLYDQFMRLATQMQM